MIFCLYSICDDVYFVQDNASYFVKMSPDTSTDMVADYMDKAWKLRTPNIILSIISSPDHWKKWMNQRQKEDFQKGIIEVGLTIFFGGGGVERAHLQLDEYTVICIYFMIDHTNLHTTSMKKII